MSEAAPAKHILIVSASTGGGHMRAAEALEKSLRERYPQMRVTNVDMMAYVSWLFKKLYADAYLDMMLHRRRLFELLYDMTDRDPELLPMQHFRLWLQRMNSRTAWRKFLAVNADHVITTHFTAAEMLARARQKGQPVPPVSVVVTDFDVHWMWIHRALDEFFVADEEAGARLAGRGVPRDRIHVTGIPVCPQFARAHDGAACRRAAGLPVDGTTVMLMAGGFGVSRIDRIARKLLDHAHGLRVIAVAGRNAALHESLQAVARDYPGRMAAVGFTDRIEEYMAASDLVITKPGGLTTSECLALGKPMIMIDPIPGQEVHNATYVMEKGAGVMAYDEIGIMFKLDWILGEPGRLAQMQAAARTIGTPQASYDVLNVITERYALC